MKLRSVFFWSGWLLALTVCGYFEWSRLQAAIDSPAGAFGWFANWNIDTTLPLLVLVILPALLVVRRGEMPRSATGPSPLAPGHTERGDDGNTGHQPVARKPVNHRGEPGGGLSNLSTLLIVALSFAVSASVGFREMEVASSDGTRSFRLMDLPPAYHDEYSYLLQAESFRHGRLSWPPAPVAPQLFHQIHVLSEPVTASRYFPWTGLWMTPFLCLKPWLGIGASFIGNWLAASLAAGFFHRAMLRLVSFRCALVAGLLIAISPGLAVFSNLLLAHQPTMLALSVFLMFMLRILVGGRRTDAVIAGFALTLAMLGRPMTAAGFALPFGCALLWRIVRRDVTRDEGGERLRWTLLPAISGPIALGFIALAIINVRVTGDWFTSPYHLYTDVWTPSHRFGFNNAIHEPGVDSSRVLVSYDRWATNLNPARAVENVWNRLLASAQWAIGIPALLMLILGAMPEVFDREHRNRRLVLYSIISLHLVHVPYWFDGILHWHYVYETAPLLIMLSTIGLSAGQRVLSPRIGRQVSAVWLTAILTASLLPSWLDAETFWGSSRVTLAVGEQSFSRVRFQQFHDLTGSDEIVKPCLILVDESSSDPQLSYIINPPGFQSEVLVCRKPERESDLVALRSGFPDRTLYEFDPATFEVRAVPATR